MVVDEVVLHVLQGEGRLAHTAVTKHHYPIPGRWFRLQRFVIVMFDKDDDDGQKPPQSRIPEVTVDDDDDVDNDDGDDDDDETS